ncbi:hypothetical protein D3C78_1213730 [compost metagenome]
MDASDQVYDIKEDNSHNERETKVGATDFDFRTGYIVISMPTGGGFGLLAHELKHAYQFETGKFSIGREIKNNTIPPFLLYDKTDEVEAYQRGSLFGGPIYGINNLPSQYANLPVGPIDTSNLQIFQDVNSSLIIMTSIIKDMPMQQDLLLE